MVPWPIRRVTDLPPNAKLHEMQQNMVGRDQYGYITTAFSGSPWCGEKIDGKWVQMVENK